ncbi:nuclease-related domain-containing protein [Leekyejoonella antrihumi]|uniref:nuclease-related domain-containing protein n=1 Tax=Leekyejoonella antrihumi TaxID=1660198 RepID=UPI001FE7A498|nr:nuclease-related domain-containing protein [Leekyejoonella antrihumi]
MALEPAEKHLRLRYAGTCRVCGLALPVRAEGIYDRVTKTVRCAMHGAAPTGKSTVMGVVEADTPGASARREFERRKAKREGQIRAKHPRMGGLILAVSDERQSTKAWDRGAVGEEKLGSRLNELASETLRLLHDRRIPGGRANIDHLAVTPTGIYVIDAKKYRGRPHLRTEGGLVRPRVERLLVGSRDRTKLVDGVLKHVDVVRRVLGDDLPVHGVLCFVDADWPMIGGAFTTRGVQALWPKKLYPKLQAAGPLAVDSLADIHWRLASALPPA